MVISLYATTGYETGEIEIQWDSVKGARCYIIQMSTGRSKNPSWRHIDIVDSPKYTVMGLRPGRIYSFRIAVVTNNEGQGSWSEPIIKKAK